MITPPLRTPTRFPVFGKNSALKKQYAKALKTGGKVKKTAEATAKAAKKTAQETKRATFFVVRH